MIKMPEDIKQELRQLSNLCKQAEKVENKLDSKFLSYGINPDILKGLSTESIKTEAFTNIINGFGDIEENIKSIEKVFLHYVRRNKR